mmetsp:Transcript_64713/g.153018  ORF Transcript_64713/g.153018 Transcript_64713/m.153018 type:complete len:220 (+) Transcript_64713:136-795(+)
MSFPEKVLKISGLRVLTIEGCSLSSLPKDFTRIAPALKQLSLARNSLKSFPEPGAFVMLETLDLHDNSLKDLPERGWERLERLTKLILGGNKLRALPAGLGNCQKLQLLDASNNHLESVPPQLATCGELVDLELSTNQISLLPTELSGLRKLRRLHLSSNRIGSLPEELLTSTPVEKILVDGNPIVLEDQPGFEAYNGRRVQCIDKQLETGGSKIRLGL